MRYEYATIEWLWDAGELRIDRPGQEVVRRSGAYDVLVTTLTELGGEGWQVKTTVAAANWLFYTLERER